ncbi:HAD family hydrolase [Arenibacter latericius]|uniref:HAD family hydrolase n=1 Tax=Arenibacter latericius TaxID=86104 RepID=UPI0003F816F4|nr:HAD family phosphatase [Arenibacter latericius]
MIKVIIFDLDGTLIQTEVLKARSYAEAIHLLTNEEVSIQQVMESFKDYVGLSRMEVVAGIVKEYNAELKKNFGDGDLKAMQQWVLDKRLSQYRSILENESLLKEHFCPFNLGLLHKLHQDKYKLVLATMSHLTEASKILNIMGIEEKLDAIFTRDDVEKGKPDPEIYNKAKKMMQVASDECLVIEDSVNGIKAALNAEMNVFAVTNSITRKSVHESNLLPNTHIIDDLTELEPRVYRFINK